MKRMSSPLIAAIGLLTLIAVATPAHAVYTVILKDGSFVRAADKPVVEGGFAVIRLPNGLLAQIDARRINWKRSDELSRQAEVLFRPEKPKSNDLLQPKVEIEGTITMTGPDASQHPLDEEGGEAPARAPAAPTGGPDALSRETQEQIENVDSIIENLRYQKQQLQREVEQKKYNLDVVKSIREQITEIDNKLRLAQQERERMVRDLQRRP